MFKCFECNEEFEEPKTIDENRGEFWGIPCTERMYYCPCCGGEAFGLIAFHDVYDTPVCESEEYYDFSGDKVALENLEDYIEAYKCIA